MRSLGDMGWLNDYIGLPYKFGGRGRDGLDCYGLVKLVYLEQYEEVLPDWAMDEIDVRARDAAITSQVTSGTWTDKEQPSDGDFVVCYRTRAAHHLGLFYGGGVLHCAEGMGVVYEPLPRFVPQYVKVKFGEWYP